MTPVNLRHPCTRLLWPTALALLFGVPSAASDSPPPADENWAGVAANGAVFHDFAGMCYLDHATCPFPWEAGGNFVGPPCTIMSGPDFYYAYCDGIFKDLWFNFLLGWGADLSLAGQAVSHLRALDQLHLEAFRGVVAMSCDLDAPDGAPECATNFTGIAALAQKWDCYIHWNPGPSEDCANDGP